MPARLFVGRSPAGQAIRYNPASEAFAKSQLVPYLFWYGNLLNILGNKLATPVFSLLYLTRDELFIKIGDLDNF